MGVNPGRRVPMPIGVRRDGFQKGILWNPDALIGMGEGTALSRLQMAAMEVGI